ncbi:ATP-binding response regulator [Caenimonas soli]|uniref:ATP-binding response regulator n=1 Tax=Caenimonas soli TaxID=2735555 RepID=UPI001556467D|nr:hybrid sensor histidine kinase/response regulator [Caenimonas soli]NPC56091.1 hybrid sensor histidine kinase/response regulator [Caenimonas soli]
MSQGDTTAASADASDELIARSIAMILPQSRAGAATAIVLGAMFGFLFVPAAGWAPYLAWYGIVAAGFIGRQVYFERQVARQGATRRSLFLIAAVSAVTGWMAVACVPLFARFLSVADIGVLTIVMVGWIALAVSVLAVQPRIYLAYIFACLATVYVGWMWHANSRDLIIIGLAMILGGLMLARLARTIWMQLSDTVQLGRANADLVGQLRTSLAMQQEAQRSRSRFLGAASHDLRQPVQALLLLADIFRRSSDTDRRETVALQMARTAESIDSMFKGLVDLAQIDAGTMKVALQPLHVEQLVQGASLGFPEKCAVKGLFFRIKAPPDAGGLTVSADAVLLERILRNLLDNAYKFSLKGEIVLEISSQASHALIEVRDQGIGMDASDLKQACNAFFRGRSASVAEAEGIGLGLAICKHMAGLMGAELTLESRVGAGTRIALRLPMASITSVSTARAERLAALAGITVAVIEDDRIAREALKLWLEEAGGRVICASGLDQLLSSLRDAGATPDFIVADYRLASGNGLAAIQRLRTEYGAVPAVIVSGERHLALDGYGIPVLQKPVAPQQLMEHICSALPAGAQQPMEYP